MTRILVAWFHSVFEIALGGFGVPLGLLSFALPFEFTIFGRFTGGFLDLTGNLINSAFCLVGF